MSLRTRINGYTAWINLRLVPYGSLLNNVLTDLLKGNHLQQLLHSLTGKKLKKIQSLDGLTQQQKVTRVEWFVKELKVSDILPEDVTIDARLVAQKSADHVFDLLWRLVSYDIWFTWERMEYLLTNNDKTLSECLFQWTPIPPPKKKKKRVIRTTETMLSGFGSASPVSESRTPSPDHLPEGYEPFPNTEKMKNFKNPRPKGGWYSYPGPDECILDMINCQLETVSEGRKLTVFSLDDLVESRVLCGLINSFVPGTFTTELLLNDRWTINLALKTIGEMLRASNPMASEDLSEADPKSICSFMCFFFMCSYKLRQSEAVIRRLKELKLILREKEAEVAKFPETLSSRQEWKQKQAIQDELEERRQEQDTLLNTYDVEFINDWLGFIKQVKEDTRTVIIKKMKERFDLLRIPRHMTINELCLSHAINLQLTQGIGFYRAYEHESCNPDRRLVLRNKETKEFLDDFTNSENQKNIRDILELPRDEVIILEPAKYPKYEIYIESLSRNKTLHAGSTFLYQVFPGNTAQWQRMFFKSVKEGDLDIVVKMVTFFIKSHPDFIHSKDSNYGNTALHIASRFGHFDICKYLLEHGCSVNTKNQAGCTPLFSTAEGLHFRVAKLLIEWGCNAKAKNARCQTAFDVMRNEEMKISLQDAAKYWSTSVPEIVKGNTETLKSVIKNHISEDMTLVDTGSRCVHGSTLLHTATHFSQVEAIEDLLKLRVDVNLRDYQGATPLHRAKQLDALKLLLESNADISAADMEGNTALHVQCYGEDGRPSFLEGISYMIEKGCDVYCRNSRSLMPIHCAAMQGRENVIKLFLDHDEGAIRTEIEKEGKKSPPSLPYLALAGDHLECAQWLVNQTFCFKTGEADKVMYKILTEQLIVNDRSQTVKFLLDNGASVKLSYSGGDSILHLAVLMSGPTDVLEIFLDEGAKVNAANESKSTPLFYAMQVNNFYGASVLIQKGAQVQWTNNNGLTALDLINDFDEWIFCGYFTEETVARLKVYKMKRTRELFRTISNKIRRGSQNREEQKKKRDAHLMMLQHAKTAESIAEHFRKSLRVVSPDVTKSRPGTRQKMVRPKFTSQSLPAITSKQPRGPPSSSIGRSSALYPRVEYHISLPTLVNVE